MWIVIVVVVGDLQLTFCFFFFHKKENKTGYPSVVPYEYGSELKCNLICRITLSTDNNGWSWRLAHTCKRRENREKKINLTLIVIQ